MNAELEERIEKTVGKVNIQYLLIGLATWISPLIYTVVIALLCNANPQEATEHSEDITLLTYALTAMAVVVITPMAFAASRLLPRFRLSKAGIQSYGLDDPALRGLSSELGGIRDIYFHSAMISMAVSQAPAIFALVCALLLFAQEALFSDHTLLACIIFMGVYSLILTLFFIPTGGRLRRFLQAYFDESTQGQA